MTACACCPARGAKLASATRDGTNKAASSRPRRWRCTARAPAEPASRTRWSRQPSAPPPRRTASAWRELLERNPLKTTEVDRGREGVCLKGGGNRRTIPASTARVSGPFARAASARSQRPRVPASVGSLIRLDWPRLAKVRLSSGVAPIGDDPDGDHRPISNTTPRRSPTSPGRRQGVQAQEKQHRPDGNRAHVTQPLQPECLDRESRRQGDHCVVRGRAPRRAADREDAEPEAVDGEVASRPVRM